MNYTDEELIEKYLNGDDDSFNKLYKKYRIILYNFILSLIRDQEDAEDIFQETFMKVIDKISTYKNENFKAFLFTIARNKVIDKIRKKSKNTESNFTSINHIDNDNQEYKYNETYYNNVEEYINTKFELKKLHNAIESLPYEYREIIYLKHFANLTFEEISKITNTPIGTLLSRFKRALEKLKKILYK